MPSKAKPADLHASPEATEEYGRLKSAIRAVDQERSRLVCIKRKAKGKSKKELAGKISELESVKPLLLPKG